MRPILTITAFLLFVAWLGLIDYADSLPEPGTDSAVGCIDDCLDPMEPEYQPEPLPVKEV